MQPTDPARRPQPRPHASPPAAGFAAGESPPGAATDAPLPCTTLRLDAPALLVEAFFREVPLASRLMRADLPGAFMIGASRGADAPVNPAWLPAPVARASSSAPPAHALVAREPDGFVVNLTPAMRAELRTPVQRLALPADLGVADAPLALPADATLRIPCGEVTFELRAAEPALALPRPWFSRRWWDDARYTLAVALAFGVLLALARFVPSDPRALSLDALGAAHRYDHMVTIPLDVTAPPVEQARGARQAGGPGARPAAGSSGRAGDRKARPSDGRLAIPGAAANAREAAARVRSNPMLTLLDGRRAGALAEVLAEGPVLGADETEAFGHLVGTTIADAYGVGGLGPLGTGDGGGGAHEGTIGAGTLRTLGRFAGGDGDGPSYGSAVGTLGRHVARVPQALSGVATVRGTLDKEIIRRTVRRHLNEVRFCYEQALVGRPSLQGRLVVQFTIAPTGRVLAAVLQSSSLNAAAVEACVVAAVRRWEFPQPAGGGLAIVSYPFQLAPAGG